MVITVNGADQSWKAGPTGNTPLNTTRVVSTGFVQWGTTPDRYALPEGAYPPDFPSSHDYHPPDISGTGDPEVMPAVNVRSQVLVMIAVPEGTSPGAAVVGGGGRTDGMEVLRDTTWAYSDIVNANPLITGNYDLYFIFNDGEYSNNSGSYTVTTTTSTLAEDDTRIVYALPGHMTDQDIETAGYCQELGFLTPGNRLRTLSDGRQVCDLVSWLREGPDEDWDF